MIIKEIEFNNFRIYKGKNRICLTPEDGKNIIVVSGNNGFGKTTFLMALVWCLYGKQMEKVDELYKREIAEKGGYGRYIGNSLNYQAEKDGETRFSVSITFSDVVIPDTACTEITITRSYDNATGVDEELDIFIDGRSNDLFVGSKEEKLKEEEIFIRDYILPIEIAKFFFFDAEKIVSFAQINTPEQRHELSRAYSQVLGIQKYDDLKNELERIQDDYRKDSAKPEDRVAFNGLLSSIKNDEDEIKDIEETITKNDEDIMIARHDSNELQEKLVREGDLMSLEKLNELRENAEGLQSSLQSYEAQLKDLYNLIPFALAGNLVSEVNHQLDEETAYKKNKLQQAGVKDQTENILNDLEQAKQSFGQHIDIRIRDFYEGQIRSLIKKYFYHDVDVNRFEHFSLLHDFPEMEINSFKDLVFKIKDSKSLFDKLNNEYSKAKAELYSIEKKIREAEKHAENDYVQELRRKKERIDEYIMHLMQDNADKLSRKRQLVEQIAANRKQKDSLSKKIEVANKNKKVDTVAGKLIYKIQKFLISFKEQKKKALEQKLMEKLRLYLHKDNLVKNVIVDITGNGDDVDINLYDFDNRKIDKGNLSMGERQMFASALLGALVEETEIEFPVFIDSPMQKFDASHTRNVLTRFYPKVSKQVVLFPLLMKEMTESEYKMISPLVGKAYLIENSDNGSSFTEVNAETLFDKYKELKLC